MSVETYGRWPWVAAGLVAPTWTAAIVRRHELRREGAWVAALALPILVSHQTEEWVWPGDFLPFCNRRLLGSDRPTWPLTERDGFHVNVTVGWGTATAAGLLWRRTPVLAAAVLGLEAANAAMHATMALRARRYNPGVVTGALLMATHAAAGGRWL
ncbi:MAG: HXXEE domain-containing protein, partial [Gaiellaceae bacterium]